MIKLIKRNNINIICTNSARLKNGTIEVRDYGSFLEVPSYSNLLNILSIFSKSSSTTNSQRSIMRVLLTA